MSKMSQNTFMICKKKSSFFAYAKLFQKVLLRVLPIWLLPITVLLIRLLPIWLLPIIVLPITVLPIRLLLIRVLPILE